MSFGATLVAIVAIIAWVVRNQQRQRYHAAPPAPESDPAIARELADLRARVAVLERILTDQHESTRIAREIEALRDR